MKNRWLAPDVVILAVVALGLATAWAVRSSRPVAAGTREAEAAHGLTLLPGLGRAIDLSGCAAAFDPRLAADCDSRHFPLPGGDSLCADHFLPGPWSER